jgi:hypothetical protein
MFIPEVCGVRDHGIDGRAPKRRSLSIASRRVLLVLDIEDRIVISIRNYADGASPDAEPGNPRCQRIIFPSLFCRSCATVDFAFLKTTFVTPNSPRPEASNYRGGITLVTRTGPLDYPLVTSSKTF